MIKRKSKCVSYAKWGYIFLIPFFVTYLVFSLIPLVSTFYNSFFENYLNGLIQVGPKFVGFQNYKSILFDSELPTYLKNTGIIWIMGFIPQILVSLLLAAWFTDLRLKLKTGVFKTIIYLPNLIMAAAFSMLFYAMFSDGGPINNFLTSMGFPTYRFLAEVAGTRGLISFMNFLMWFGNTTIILMAAIMGIDTTVFEAARIDGANAWQTFNKITMPLIKPITAYVLITSMIGGIQMFDVPQILTNGNGNPDRTSMTAVMYLNKHLYSKNYGMAGALSVILFIITCVLSLFVYSYLTKESNNGKVKKSKKGGSK